MEERANHTDDDDNDKTEEIHPTEVDSENKVNLEERERDLQSTSTEESNKVEEHDGKHVLFLGQEDQCDCAKEENSTSCSGDRDSEGNLLGSVITMHNITNCDDDISQTLAICDIFNKTKESPKHETPVAKSKEENKDEFLIIDLDTCQMERTSQKSIENDPIGTEKNITQEEGSASKDLVLVNLSSQDEDQSDFLTDLNDSESCSEHNFLYKSKVCNTECPDQIKQKENSDSDRGSAITPEIEDKDKSSEFNESKSLHEYNDLPTEANIKYENCLQNKEIIFPDVARPDESIISKGNYSTDVSFQSSDLNDVSLNSNENEDMEPVFYMPELYTKHCEVDKNNDQNPCSFPKLSSHNSSLGANNSNQYCEYDISDNASFDTSISANQYNPSMTHDFYEQQQQTPNIHHYNFENKIISNFLSMDTNNDTSSTYGLSRRTEKPTFYKNRVSATTGSHKFSPYSSVPEHTSNTSFFHSPNVPNYRPPYPYTMQQTSDVNPQILPTSASNYSDWNPWSSSAFYEVNLNTFSSVHNMESQYPHGKDEWPNDGVMPDIYRDPEMSVKSSSQLDVDSEATEDADETDDVPIFFEDSTDFSACDNLSTMSVMSGSCYSDNSSVMAPMSPTDFTPPPSVSNTTIPPSHHDTNTTDDHRFDYHFVNENSRSEPLHLYSQKMLSVTPYKLSNEKIEQNLMNYGRGQGIKRYYPSMADMHNSRSGLSIPSSSSKFNADDMFDFSDYRKPNKNQIQSDKISTSTSRSAYNKKNACSVIDSNQSFEPYIDYVKQEDTDFRNDSRRLRHNEPLRQTAIRIMTQWYEDHLNNPYPTKEDKIKIAREGGITVTQVKSWFANKRNRTNNTKPKVQKRAMKEKLKKLFQDLSHSRSDSLDNSHIIQQLSGIIQN